MLVVIPVKDGLWPFTDLLTESIWEKRSMYSLVLFAALSGSGDLPAGDVLPAYPNGGCNGHTIVYGDCTGSARQGHFFSKHFHRNRNSGCFGCNGGCFGCNGGVVGAPVVTPAGPHSTAPVLPNSV